VQGIRFLFQLKYLAKVCDVFRKTGWASLCRQRKKIPLFNFAKNDMIRRMDGRHSQDGDVFSLFTDTRSMSIDSMNSVVIAVAFVAVWIMAGQFSLVKH